MYTHVTGMLGPRSDTMSSDIIVNSISRGMILSYVYTLSVSVCVYSELEALETQLSVVEEDAARYKKAARLWKARYKQERTARYNNIGSDILALIALIIN